jgi:HEAT repeat protein
LIQHYDPANLPKFDELMGVQRQIAGMDARMIYKALPSVIAAFGHRDDTVKKYAAAAIYSIGERSDGTALLKPYAKAIGGGLDVSNTDLQGATLQLLAMLKPGPQSETVPLLVAFVKRTDRSPVAQAYAISLLLQIAPENPGLTPALQEFAARSMDQETKDALINGIANSNTENVIATDVLVGALKDPTEGVRFQAAQAFQRMPKDMVARAKPALQKVMGRPDESEEVKSAAKEALKAKSN